MTYDPLIMNPQSWRYLVRFSVANKIVVVVPSNTMLKSGGLISLEADYKGIGRQTGLLIERILKNPQLLKKTKLQFPKQRRSGVNLKLMDALEVRVAQPVIDRANYRYP